MNYSVDMTGSFLFCKKKWIDKFNFFYFNKITDIIAVFFYTTFTIVVLKNFNIASKCRSLNEVDAQHHAIFNEDDCALERLGTLDIHENLDS